MREPAFLRKNKDKWLEYERTLFQENADNLDPDRLARLYVQLTDDLAYARTFYPKSQTVKYLNGLAARTHLKIYKSKKEQSNRLLTFWTHELPAIFFKAQKFMFYSFLIFTFSFLIGLISALNGDEFIRTILGDGYVDMTIRNIENGDPMGVYKDSSSFIMFLQIAMNNIWVSFLVFALGIVFSFGVVFGIPFPPFNLQTGLFYNGVMVGAFIGLFHTQGMIWEALPVIYIHGTLELSAIVIAGGAGFMLGNSLLFPSTYTRAQAVQAAAKDGVKIMVGLIPVFIMAAWLESYITRLTEMPLWLKLIIIIASLGFIVWYYILYPIHLKRKENTPQLLLGTT